MFDCLYSSAPLQSYCTPFVPVKRQWSLSIPHNSISRTELKPWQRHLSYRSFWDFYLVNKIDICFLPSPLFRCSLGLYVRSRVYVWEAQRAACARPYKAGHSVFGGSEPLNTQTAHLLSSFITCLPLMNHPLRPSASLHWHSPLTYLHSQLLTSENISARWLHSSCPLT